MTKKELNLETIQEFYNFLQWECPDCMSVREIPNLTKKQAFAVIYYLKEHLRVFPDTIEICDNCDGLFDLNKSGIHCEKCGFFCGCCDDNCTCYEQD